MEMSIMNESIFDNVGKGLCVICSIPVKVASRMTCSEKCHDEFVKLGEKKFGATKKVVDTTTGVSYSVPTKDIIEKGLAWRDLRNYPVWIEKDEKK
jgi:hypothetical protein